MKSDNVSSLTSNLAATVSASELLKDASYSGSVWEGVGDLACGSAAGMIGKLIEHPFDTVKVRLQTQSQFAGPLNCIAATFRHEGISGFFRGLPAPLMGSMLENATLFFAYRHCQNFVQTLSSNHDASLTIAQLALSGGLAGAGVSFVLTPFELIKCRVQVANLVRAGESSSLVSPAATNRHVSNPSTLSVLFHTIRTDGLASFYRGHLGTFLRESGGGAAYFGIYEAACRFFIQRQQISSSETVTKSELKAWQLMAAGGMAGIGFNGAMFPADAIKSRIQTASTKVGFLEMASIMYRHGGMRSFYRGCGITLIRSIPSNACILYTYETLSKHFQVSR